MAKYTAIAANANPSAETEHCAAWLTARGAAGAATSQADWLALRAAEEGFEDAEDWASSENVPFLVARQAWEWCEVRRAAQQAIAETRERAARAREAREREHAEQKRIAAERAAEDAAKRVELERQAVAERKQLIGRGGFRRLETDAERDAREVYQARKAEFEERLDRAIRLYERLAPLLDPMPTPAEGLLALATELRERVCRAWLTPEAVFLRNLRSRFNGPRTPWERRWADVAARTFAEMPEEYFEEVRPLGVAWVVVRDLATVVPPGVNAEPFARNYREHTPWRESEMIVCVEAGEPVAFIIIACMDQVRRWCETVEGGERYTVDVYADDPEQSYYASEPVHLPAGLLGAHAARAPHTALLAAREPVASDAILVTGIPELDALYVSGGLPADACRMVVTAETRIGKTSFSIDQAEAHAEQGAEVVIATTSGEDTAAELMVRRLQRLGCPRATANAAVKGQPDGAAWAARGVRELNPNIHVVTDALVDQLIRVEGAAAIAAGRPFVLIVDTVQHAKSTNSIGRDGRLAVDAVLADLAAAQNEHPCLIIVAAHVSRSAAIEVARGRLNPLHSAKESGGVETWAKSFLYLSAGKEKGAIRFRLAKNKDGEEGDFEVAHNRATQSFGGRSTAALAARQAERDAEILADVIRALQEKGPLSARKLRGWVKANEGSVRAVLAAAVGSGTLVLEGTLYRIA